MIRGGITNLTPAQALLIATTFALAFLIGYISWWDIESDLSEGEIDHGDAAFAYQMLAITVAGAILGREKLEGFVNNVIMDILVFIGARCAGFGWNGNLKTGACQYIGLMLIVMLALFTFFFNMWYFHFCVYYGLLVI